VADLIQIDMAASLELRSFI